MGKIKFNIVYEGQNFDHYQNTIHEYNHFKYLEDKYRFTLIEQYEFDGESFHLKIEIKDTDSIDWRKFEIPQTVLGLINDILGYTEAKMKIDKLLIQIKGTRFEERYQLKRLGDEVISIYSDLKLSDHIENSMIQQRKRCADLAHTLNKEVSAINLLKDKDAQYKKKNYLADAIRNLDSNIFLMVRALDDLKLVKK
ncbi:MAG TPA: hypothetical protein DGG95_07550 [Cytophagales bacterium]|jgi:hypothetical protein|nr:hypothetical protein [Cytophagales bacterium]